MVVENVEFSWSDDPGTWADQPAAGRLGEIAVPTLVITGAHDVPEISPVGELLVSGIGGARGRDRECGPGDRGPATITIATPRPGPIAIISARGWVPSRRRDDDVQTATLGRMASLLLAGRATDGCSSSHPPAAEEPPTR